MKKAKSEYKFVLIFAILITILSSMPYIFGIIYTPNNAVFTGFTHNIDDGAVYLSWMRQAADGNIFINNLFTSEPQNGRAFNILFLLMGWTSALTHLPLIWGYHLWRILLGIALFFVIWKFSAIFFESVETRKIAVILIGISAGFGWISGKPQPGVGPVDTWQPEAITFLSIYLNPLFLAGLILMLGSLYYLELAKRSGKIVYAVYAGFCLLILGNVHTYDIMTLALIWLFYLVLQWITGRTFPKRTFFLSIISALIAFPSVAYQFWVAAIDPVFRARVNTPILSPSVLSFISGYGLVFFGAVACVVYILVRYFKNSSHSQKRQNIPGLLLISWTIAGLFAPYVPIAQQRKLIMGYHIPLCLLAAYGASIALRRMPRTVGILILSALILLSVGSNIQFLARDIIYLRQNRTVTHYRPYLSDDEIQAMNWIKGNTSRKSIIYAPPDLALFMPSYTGRSVYYGHWSETPNYSKKIGEWIDFFSSWQNGFVRNDILSKIDADYFITYKAANANVLHTSEIRKMYETGNVQVYKVDKKGF